MTPFRELEAFDSFKLDGIECHKVGLKKYLTYDELHEPNSLEVADPNMMVELDEEKEYKEAVEMEHDFFNSLLNLIDGLEKQFEKCGGEKLTIESLKEFATDFLNMPEDP